MPRKKKDTVTENSVPAENTAACCCAPDDVQDESAFNEEFLSAGCRHKARTEEERHELIVRLNRIEGQIRGVRKMVESDVYCPDILVQVAAANAALNGFSRELLDAHIRTCVAHDIREGKDETIEELLRVLQKLMR